MSCQLCLKVFFFFKRLWSEKLQPESVFQFICFLAVGGELVGFINQKLWIWYVFHFAQSYTTPHSKFKVPKPCKGKKTLTVFSFLSKVEQSAGAFFAIYSRFWGNYNYSFRIMLKLMNINCKLNINFKETRRLKNFVIQNFLFSINHKTLENDIEPSVCYHCLTKTIKKMWTFFNLNVWRYTFKLSYT